MGERVDKRSNRIILIAQVIQEVRVLSSYRKAIRKIVSANLWLKFGVMNNTEDA